MTNTLHETRTLTNVHLSDAQKLVMTKIKASANSHVALDQINNGTNMVAARKTLSKLGLIAVNDSGAVLTDKGTRIMFDENLIDDSDELTIDGQKFADATDLKDLTDMDKEKPAEPTDPAAPAPDITDEVTEQLSLFKDIHALAKLKLL